MRSTVRRFFLVEAAIKRADLFMYNSKIGGRNRVSIDTMFEQNGRDLIRHGWSASGLADERLAGSRIKFQGLGKIEPPRLPKERKPIKK